LPKVISEKVGQTCRFATAPGRTSPTFSEITFGSRCSKFEGAFGPAIRYKRRHEFIRAAFSMGALDDLDADPGFLGGHGSFFGRLLLLRAKGGEHPDDFAASSLCAPVIGFAY